MEVLKIIAKQENTIFQFKGIRIEVDSYTVQDLPNRFHGKYFIGDSKIKNAIIYVDGEILPASVLGHFVIEEAMKDLDNKSFYRSSPHPNWSIKYKSCK